MGDKLYKKCLRCNRKLKTIKAQKRGYGDHCWKVHKKEVKQNSGLFNLSLINKK